MDEQREGESSSESAADEDESPAGSSDPDSPPADEPEAERPSSADEETDVNDEDADADHDEGTDEDEDEDQHDSPDADDATPGDTDEQPDVEDEPVIPDADGDPDDTEDGEFGDTEDDEFGDAEDGEPIPPGTEGVDDDAMADYADAMEPVDETDVAETEGEENMTLAGEEVDGPGGVADMTAGVQDEVDDGIIGEQEGPEIDEELPLAVHIEEMVRRLLVVIAVAGVVTIIAYPFSEELLAYLWQAHIPNPMENRPRVYGPLEFILTKLKIASLSGTIVGLPVLVYQSYRFMRPGLYPHERRYYLSAVPTSLVLALIGVTFAHFVVLPSIFVYFTTYTKQAAVVAYGLRETFNLILVLMGYMAIVFQIPLFVMLATMMDLVSRQWMENKRLLFWGSFAGLAFLVSPDPTGMAPIIIAATMVVLFEGTLALMRWTGH